MTAPNRLPLTLVITLCWFLACSIPASAQTQQGPAAKDQTDVVKVYTELVQTDVMVFDKQGQFVHGLSREDFELRIDGKPRPIEFFERITAGSVNEESQLAAARGSAQPTKAVAGDVVPLDRGRTVFFYVDDVHLDLRGALLTRKLISDFIDKEMSQNDEAAIISATGQIGFLQQLTDNRTVLKSALERLRPRTYSVTDMQRPPMSEYQALLVDRYDRDVTNFFVEAILSETPNFNRDSAEAMVRSRAQGTLAQASVYTKITLLGLDSLVRAVNKLPGRKVIFFLSNGFFLDNRNSDSMEMLQRLTSAAARNGVVIYSMDARGLVAGLTDASTEVAFDPSGRLDRASQGELLASQDALNALARDTGGRPIFNTNALGPGLKKALQETSVYYLLAWKPESGTQPTSKFRKIEVRLVGKPDLSLRVRRGFFDLEPERLPEQKNKGTKPAQKTTEKILREVIAAPQPLHDLPISLGVSHVNTPDKGELLSVSVQISGNFLSFAPQLGISKAVADVVGVIFDDQGRSTANVYERLGVTVPLDSSNQPVERSNNSTRDLNYTFPVYLRPGLYQVRIAARDTLSGKAGSAHAWIEIPNLASGQLSLSSLLIGERNPATVANASTGRQILDGQINLSINHRFHRDSYLRFLVFTYNATPNVTNGKPDLAVQLQVVREGLPVITTALRKIDTEGIADPVRPPYAAEIPLANLPAGRYVLNVTVVDRVSKRSASQQSRFEIE